MSNEHLKKKIPQKQRPEVEIKRPDTQNTGVDMETARRACVESIGVTGGFRPVSELREAHADHIVSKPEEILDRLSDLF